MARVWLHYGIYMLRACLIYGNLMGRKRHFLYITMAEIWLMTLMTTIPAPQSQSQWEILAQPPHCGFALCGVILEQGLYFLQIKNEKGWRTVKFVVR